MMSIFKHSPPLGGIDQRQRSMLRCAFVIMTSLLWATSGWAQSVEAAPPIEIESESGELDVTTGAYLLKDDVRINRGTLSVFADEGRAFAAESGGFERVELYGAPTRWNDTLEDGSQVDGESDEIIYDFTTNLITMRGNAEIRNIQGQFSGNQLVYNLDTQRLVGDGGVRLLIEPATTEAAMPEINSEAANEQPGDPPAEVENDAALEDPAAGDTAEDAD